MTICLEDTVRYVCRKCGWRWSRRISVKLTPALVALVKTGSRLSRPISVPEGSCCKEADEYEQQRKTYEETGVIVPTQKDSDAWGLKLEELVKETT